jgi:hypothetical protein
VLIIIKTFTTLARNRHDSAKMSPANMLTIRIHNISGIFLIIGYMIHGIQQSGTWSPMIVPLFSLIILYLPVVFTIFVKWIPLKPGDRFIDH